MTERNSEEIGQSDVVRSDRSWSEVGQDLESGSRCCV